MQGLGHGAAIGDPASYLLEAANLISTVRHGREKLHYFNPVPVHAIYERWIGREERQRLAALHEFKRKLEANDDE